MVYKMQTELADALRSAGVRVVEHPGWRSRGRPPSTGEFNPRALLMHHDASAKGPTPGEPAYLLNGRPPATPGPLAQLWVAFDGTWHVLAAGRANHAGLGKGIGPISANQGNRDAIGIEWDHTTGEAVPPATRDSIVRGLAGLARYLGINPLEALYGHLEYAPGRKYDPDPGSLPMRQLRIDVAAATFGRVVSYSRLLRAVKDRKAYSGVRIVAGALYREGYRGFIRSRKWGPGKSSAWRKYAGLTNIVDRASLERLGRDQGFRVID